MKTLEQLKAELSEVQTKKNELVVKESEIGAYRDILYGLRSVKDSIRRHYTPSYSSKVPHVYSDALAKFPMDVIEAQILHYESEVNNYQTHDSTIYREERILNDSIEKIERHQLKSEELLELDNQVLTVIRNSNYNNKYYYNLSNYKKDTLFNQRVLYQNWICAKIEEGMVRKASMLTESGFFESKLYVNVLNFTSKMRTTYIITEDSDEIVTEMSVYDSKAEVFQKIGTLPSSKKETFLEDLKKVI
jgi:ATP-dependent 26S proteasome regulatory subunit